MRFARPAILDEIPRGHTVIEASAGTGKTWTLEHLFIDLLIDGAELDEILVVTFTEKATREMRARVRSTLDAIVHPRPDDPRLDPPEGPAWEVDAATRVRLLDALIAFDRAPISTIHGFCQRVLAEHAFQSQRPFRQTLVEPRRAFGRAFRDELRAVLRKRGPLREVVLRVLEGLDAERLEGALFPWYVEHGRPRPAFERGAFRRGLLALADEERWRAATEAVQAHVPRRDLAARICAELEALHGIAKEHATEDTLLDALLAVDAWGQREVVRDAPARTWLPARLMGEGLEDARQWVAELLDVATSPFGVLVHELVPRVRRRLESEKARHGWIDFDDMLRLVLEAIEGPSGPGLVAALRRQHRFALVDEFQDTDAIQWSIFRHLFVDGSEAGERRALYVIGDPKQAIYGFRNADVHTYRRARATLEAAGAPRVVLRDNYRSTAQLIEATNAIFAGDFFEGSIRYDEPVRCGNRSQRAVDASGQDAASLCLWQPLGREKPTIGGVRYTLADRCAREIRRIVEEEPLRLVQGDGERPISYSDIFVLTRNAREAVVVADVLRARGVPHVFYKQDGLFKTPEARDVLAVLRAVADPHDRSARMKAWLTPFFAVPLADLEACRELDPQHPLIGRLHRLRALAERREGAALLRALLEESGLARRLLFARQGERALTNYRHVLEVLLEESGGRRGADELVALLEAFVEGRAEPVGGEGSVQRVESERSAVQLLTMHKSKGLEAAVVFVLGGFTRGGSADPHEPQICHRDGEREAWLAPVPAEVEGRIAQEAREEDERLLYVALTRAKARVYLPYFGMPPITHGLEVGQRYESLTGPYRWLARRLEVLVGEGFVDGRRVTYESVPIVDRGADERRPLELAHLDALPAVKAPERLDLERLRRAHLGYVLTSYTRMKGQEGGYVAPSVVDDGGPGEEFAADVQDAVADAPQDLPGGAGMGVFLHGVLEDIDFATLRGSDDAEAWASRPEVQRVFEQRARGSGVDEAHWRAAAELIFQALKVPQRFGEASLPDGLAQIDAKVPEMSFHYPVPEPEHPPLGEPGPRPARRGIIRGVVDLVFEHEGRTYFLDWKSDRLPAGDPRTIAAHVAANYALQAKLYTLGIVRLLELRSQDDLDARFGGLLYCFLRAMNAPGRGVHFERPTWSDVVAWEQELRGSDHPWGYALRPEIGS